MAGGESHLVNFCHIPSAHYHASRVGIILQSIHNALDLVDVSTIIVRPRTPLMPINRAQFAVFVGPFVPNSHTIFLKIFHVCVSIEKPKQFVNNGFEVQLLRSEQRKALCEVKTHLVSENT